MLGWFQPLLQQPYVTPDCFRRSCTHRLAEKLKTPLRPFPTPTHPFPDRPLAIYRYTRPIKAAWDREADEHVAELSAERTRELGEVWPAYTEARLLRVGSTFPHNACVLAQNWDLRGKNVTKISDDNSIGRSKQRGLHVCRVTNFGVKNAIMQLFAQLTPTTVAAARSWRR